MSCDTASVYSLKTYTFLHNNNEVFSGAENVYTQHEPLITKELLPDIVRGRQRTDLTYLRTPVEVPNKVILFMIGGVTYEETRAVATFNKDHGSNVVIGGTAIHNFDSFMANMQEVCCINKQ